MTETITFSHASACVFTFKQGGVNEYHVMVRITDATLPYQQQLDAVLDAYQQLIEGPLQGAVAVFKRYFLSDAANQADDVVAADTSDCAKSIIEQAPLDGTKLALWAYLMTGVSTRLTESGLYEVVSTHLAPLNPPRRGEAGLPDGTPPPSGGGREGAYRHLWNGSAHNLAANSEYQTRLLFNEYVMQLAQEGCKLSTDCMRTWLFVNDIDLNYGGVVRARNQVFFTQGLTHDTHFIASTGIGGRAQDPCVLTQMDNYAVSGLQAGQVRHLYAPTHLNRTSDYGVSFERGTRIDYGDRRHVLISGTASIDNKGQIVHPKDVEQQTRRMWQNVEALLAEADCTFDDVAHMIVYLRDTADYAVVSRLYRERFPQTPTVIVHAPVCRAGWLVEMECMAVKCADNPQYAPL